MANSKQSFLDPQLLLKVFVLLWPLLAVKMLLADQSVPNQRERCLDEARYSYESLSDDSCGRFNHFGQSSYKVIYDEMKDKKNNKPKGSKLSKANKLFLGKNVGLGLFNTNYNKKLQNIRKLQTCAISLATFEKFPTLKLLKDNFMLVASDSVFSVYFKNLVQTRHLNNCLKVLRDGRVVSLDFSAGDYSYWDFAARDSYGDIRDSDIPSLSLDFHVSRGSSGAIQGPDSNDVANNRTSVDFLALMNQRKNSESYKEKTIRFPVNHIEANETRGNNRGSHGVSRGSQDKNDLLNDLYN